MGCVTSRSAIPLAAFDAVNRCDTAALRRLVAGGLDLNGRHFVGDDMDSEYSFSGASLLIVAAANGHLKICEYLLEHGAAINLTDDFNQTPLKAFCTRCLNEQVCTLLLACGAKVCCVKMHFY